MIVGLQGRLMAVGANYAVINVNGISFQVFMPSSALGNLGGRGDDVELFTHLHLREDNVALFGFASPPDLELFETLITVTGVGPKLALAMLSAASAADLAPAIATGNTALLTGVPGIGRKTAERLVLELKGKLAEGLAAAPEGLAPENADVLAALTALGYSVREAGRAVASLPAGQKLALEAKVRLALQYFGGKHEGDRG